MRHIDYEKYVHVAELLNNNVVQIKIAEIVGLSKSTVENYARMLKKEPITDNEIEKYKWLKRHWHFTGRVINHRYIGTHTEDGTRIVRKGERGVLRTPYRTDGRFQ